MKSAKEIIDRVLKDPAYAEQLRELAKAAAQNGIASKEHRELIKHFVSSDNELEELISGNGPIEFGFTTATTTTTATFTTGGCITTGVTLPGFSFV